MRPLFHPALEEITVEGILHALADPVRVSILAELAAAQCSHTCAEFLRQDERQIPKSTLSQHFRVLREAGLVRAERRGVEMLNRSRCAEIEQRFPGLLPAIVNAHRIQERNERRGKRKGKASKTGSG